MSDWTPIPLSTQSYKSTSLPASAQRLVNMYPEQLPEGGPSGLLLCPTPGVTQWNTTTLAGAIRGMRVMRGLLYVVTGQKLYVLGSNGSGYELGDIAGTNDCYLTDNGSHVAIAADNGLFAANATSLVEVDTRQFCGAMYQDGYGIFPLADSQSFYITALDSMLSIAALDFSTADAMADNLVGGINDHRELWLFKRNTTEIWYNSGAAAFPFDRVPGGFIERGCAAPGSIAKTEHHVLWLGDDKAVYMSQGYQPVRISTPAVELLIDGAQSHATARALVYAQNGHTFYSLTFADLTIVYDLVTGLWHERVSPGGECWGARFAVDFASKILVAGPEGEIYELSDTVYTDRSVSGANDQIDRIFTGALIQGNGRRMVMDEMLLGIESGVGNVTGTDSDPSMLHDWSDDGGRTWSNPREAKLGQLGAYQTRVNWTRLGSFYSRVPRFRTRCSVKIAANACKARLGVYE